MAVASGPVPPVLKVGVNENWVCSGLGCWVDWKHSPAGPSGGQGTQGDGGEGYVPAAALNREVLRGKVDGLSPEGVFGKIGHNGGLRLFVPEERGDGQGQSEGQRQRQNPGQNAAGNMGAFQRDDLLICGCTPIVCQPWRNMRGMCNFPGVPFQRV